MTDASTVPPIETDDDAQPLSSREIDFVPWDNELGPAFTESWKIGEGQAEHVTIVGRTGQGKTSLALDMIVRRLREIPKSRAVILANKKEDQVLQRLINNKTAAHIKRWKDLSYEHRVKRLVVVWPTFGKASTSATKNRTTFIDAIDGVLSEGDWTLFVDDAWYWVEHMRLGALLDELWNAARTSNVSVVLGSTRPVFISRSATSQHSWAVSFAIGDLQDRVRMAEVMGDRSLSPIIEKLRNHEFLLKQTSSGMAYVSNLES